MHKLISWKQRLSRNEKIPFYLLVTFIGTLTAIGLSTALICIYFGRPVGDDFGAISFHHSSQWFDHAIQSLQSTGRYSQSVVSSVTYGVLGRHIANILPLIVFIWTGLLTYLFVSRFNQHLKLKINWPIKALLAATALMTLLTVNVGVDGTPPQTWITFQTFFWSSGIITYTVSLLTVITAAYLLFVHARTVRKASFLIYGAVVYLTGLFNEVQPATLLAFSSLIFVVSFVPTRTPLLMLARKWRMAFIATALPSFVSLLTLFLSSGNKERRASTGALNFDGLVNAVMTKTSYTVEHLFYRPRDIILMFAIGFTVAYGLFIFNKKIRPSQAQYGIAVGAILLILGILSTFISITLLVLGYGVGTGILPRTLLIPQILYVAGFLTLFTSAWVGFIHLLRHRYKKIVLAVIAVVIFGMLAWCGSRYMDKITTQLNTVMDYAHAWNYQDNLLKEYAKQQTNETIYIPGDHAGIGDGFSIRCVGPYVQNTMWLNEAIEKYYGVHKICTLEDKQ